MCDPVSLTMMGIATAGALVEHQNMAQNAKKQEAAIREGEGLQQLDLSRQMQQQAEAGAEEANVHARQAAHDASLFQVVEGEFGGGTSVSRNQSVAQIQSSESLATIQANNKMAQSETQFASLATRKQANSQLASIQQPNGVATALKIGAVATSAYGSNVQVTARNDLMDVKTGKITAVEYLKKKEDMAAK